MDDSTAIIPAPSSINRRTPSGRLLDFESQKASISTPNSSDTSLLHPDDKRTSAKRHYPSLLRVVQYEHGEKRKKSGLKRDQVGKSRGRVHKSRALATREDVLRTDKA
jgi:hypothetical protein